MNASLRNLNMKLNMPRELSYIGMVYNTVNKNNNNNRYTRQINLING